MSELSGDVNTIGLIFPELVDFGAMCWEAFDAAADHDVLLHSKHILTDDELERVLYTLVSDDPDAPFQTSELTKLALAYIHTHYTDPISRSDICQELGISKNYLSRLFREGLGLTFVEYNNRYQMHVAKQRLRESEASITVVAQQVGFDDPRI